MTAAENPKDLGIVRAWHYGPEHERPAGSWGPGKVERLTAGPNAAWKAVWRARIVPLAAGLRGTVESARRKAGSRSTVWHPSVVRPGGGPSQPFAQRGAPTRQAAAASFAAWPLIDTVHPAADIRAGASVEVDLVPIELGQRITVRWQGKPVFINYRTKAEIERAEAEHERRRFLAEPPPDVSGSPRPERRGPVSSALGPLAKGAMRP